MTTMADTVTTREGTFEIRSEAHGPHWVAWLARETDGAPDQAVLELLASEAAISTIKVLKKATLAEIAPQIAEKYGIPAISTGEIFRWAIKGRTALGLQVGVGRSASGRAGLATFTWSQPIDL